MAWSLSVITIPLIITVLAPAAIERLWPQCSIWLGAFRPWVQHLLAPIWVMGFLWRIQRLVHSQPQRDVSRTQAQCIAEPNGPRWYPDDRLWALTTGWLHPEVVISQGLRHRLSPQALAAVLAHERYHQRRRHPLGFLALQIVSAVYWPWPIVAWWAIGVQHQCELAADAEAVTMTSRRALAEAFRAVLASYGDDQVFTGAGFASSGIEERILTLAGEPIGARRPPPITQFTTVAALMMAVASLVICG